MLASSYGEAYYVFVAVDTLRYVVYLFGFFLRKGSIRALIWCCETSHAVTGTLTVFSTCRFIINSNSFRTIVVKTFGALKTDTLLLKRRQFFNLSFYHQRHSNSFGTIVVKTRLFLLGNLARLL